VVKGMKPQKGQLNVDLGNLLAEQQQHGDQKKGGRPGHGGKQQ
jgi:hypothetical protein